MLIDPALNSLPPLARNHCTYPILILNGNEQLFPALVPNLVDSLNVFW